MKNVLLIFAFLTAVFFLSVKCTDKPAIEPQPVTTTTVPETTTTTTTTLPAVEEHDFVALSWEKKDADRIDWSNWMYEHMKTGYLERFDKAKDMERLCPKYYSLNDKQKMNVWGEFWSALTYYESSWNPKSQAVDVGSPDNRDSWSIGLTQISVRDYQNKFGYNFEQLLTPYRNLHLGFEIMAIQIQKTGLVILPNSSKYRYWAVILDGNKYSKVTQISAMTKKLSFCN